MRRPGILPSLLLTAAAFAGSSGAQEPPREILVPPRLLAGTPLEMEPMLEAAAREVEGSPITLSEAVATALAGNPELAERAVLPAISEAELRAREGVYALRAFAEGYAERHVTPAASALAGANEVDRRDYGFGAGLEQPVPVSGGELTLRLDNAISETNSSFVSLSPEYVPQLSLELSQPLLRDLLVDTRRAELELAAIGVDIASLDLTTDVRDVVAEVERRYWALYFAMQDARIARLALELGEQLLRNDRRRFELGALPWPDVIDVQAAVAGAEDELVAARGRLRSASDELRRSLGLSLGGPVLLAGERPTAPLEPQEVEGLWERARRDREDLRAARVGIDGAEVRLGAARNLELPDLDLLASVGLNGLSGTERDASFAGNEAPGSLFAGSFGDSYRELASGDFFDWTVGLRLEIPLMEDEAAGEADVARLGVTAAERRLARLEQDARLEVRRAHDEARTTLERIRTTAVVVESAGENLRAEARRYELGASETDDVIRKIEAYVRALVRATRVRSDHAIAQARLDRATASNLERVGIDLDTLPIPPRP